MMTTPQYVGRQPGTAEPKRTQYAIRLIATGLYIGHNRHYTDNPQHAIAFDTMTRATLAAIEGLDLSPADYTVEAI